MNRITGWIAATIVALGISSGAYCQQAYKVGGVITTSDSVSFSVGAPYTINFTYTPGGAYSELNPGLFGMSYDAISDFRFNYSNGAYEGGVAIADLQISNVWYDGYMINPPAADLVFPAIDTLPVTGFSLRLWAGQYLLSSPSAPASIPLIDYNDPNTGIYLGFGASSRVSGNVTSVSLVSIPEPSTYAVLFGFLAFALVVLRRVRRG